MAKEAEVALPSDAPPSPTLSTNSGYSTYTDDLMVAIQAQMHNSSTNGKATDVREELTRYLEDSKKLLPEEQANILLWWKVSRYQSL
jgi:hypothetical protein